MEIVPARLLEAAPMPGRSPVPIDVALFKDFRVKSFVTHARRVHH